MPWGYPESNARGCCAATCGFHEHEHGTTVTQEISQDFGGELRRRCRRHADRPLSQAAKATRGEDGPTFCECASGAAAALPTCATAGCGSSSQPARPTVPRPAVPARNRRGRHLLRPDRLQRPLLRKGDRGKEQWRGDVGRGDELHREKMKKIKAEHGAESIAMFNHGIGVRFLQARDEELRLHRLRRRLVRQCRGRATSATC